MKILAIKETTTTEYWNGKLIARVRLLTGTDNDGTKRVFADMENDLGKIHTSTFTGYKITHMLNNVELVEFENHDELKKAYYNKKFNDDIIIKGANYETNNNTN